MSDKTKGNIILLFTALVWGTGFVAQKLGNNYLPPMTFSAVRQLIAVVIIFPLAYADIKKSGYFSLERNSEELVADRKKKMFWAFIFCGTFLTIGTMTQQASMLTVSAGKSGFITGMYIVFTPIVSVFIGKKVTAKTFACVFIAMLGFAALSLKGGLGGAVIGDWLCLLSAVAFGIQIVSVGYFVDKDNGLLISLLQFAFCGVIGLVIALIFENPTLEQFQEGMLPLLYAALISGGLGFTLQIIGQKYAEATTAALIMSLEAVFAVIFGAIFLHEMMSPRELLGCAIIFGAIILDQVDMDYIREKFGRIANRKS